MDPLSNSEINRMEKFSDRIFKEKYRLISDASHPRKKKTAKELNEITELMLLRKRHDFIQGQIKAFEKKHNASFSKSCPISSWELSYNWNDETEKKQIEKLNKLKGSFEKALVFRDFDTAIKNLEKLETFEVLP